MIDAKSDASQASDGSTPRKVEIGLFRIKAVTAVISEFESAKDGAGMKKMVARNKIP